MFITIETTDGATVLVNPVHVTHVTPSDPAYAQEGSVIHFTSDRAVQVPHEVGALAGLLQPGTAGPAGAETLLLR